MEKHATLDIDDVKADWLGGLLDFANNLYKNKTDFHPDDVDHWNFNERSQKIIEKANKAGLDKSWFPIAYVQFIQRHGFANLDLLPGVKESLLELTSLGWTFSVATDRLNSLKKNDMSGYLIPSEIPEIEHLIVEDTLAWYAVKFSSSYFPTNRIRFSNGESKSSICNEFGSRILIEDSYKNAVDHAKSYLDNSRKNYAILIDRKYNQGQDVDGIIRIRGKTFLEKYRTLVDVMEKLAVDVD